MIKLVCDSEPNNDRDRYSVKVIMNPLLLHSLAILDSIALPLSTSRFTKA